MDDEHGISPGWWFWDPEVEPKSPTILVACSSRRLPSTTCSRRRQRAAACPGRGSRCAVRGSRYELSIRPPPPHMLVADALRALDAADGGRRAGVGAARSVLPRLRGRRHHAACWSSYRIGACPDAPLRRRQPCRAGRDARAGRTTTRATTSTWLTTGTLIEFINMVDELPRHPRRGRRCPRRAAPLSALRHPG